MPCPLTALHTPTLGLEIVLSSFATSALTWWLWTGSGRYDSGVFWLLDPSLYVGSWSGVGCCLPHFSQFNLARQFFDWWPLFRHPKQRPFDLTSARRSSMLFLLSSPHLWGGWLPPQKTHELCCFGSCSALGLPLLSLGGVREENDAKLFAPWLLIIRLLSGALFFLLFNASGEKTGSFARSASSLTNSTRSWKDTVPSVFFRTSLRPEEAQS